MHALAALLLAASLTAQLAPEVGATERAEVGRTLARAVASSRAAGEVDPSKRLLSLRSAAGAAAQTLPPTSLVGARLQALADPPPDGTPRPEAASALRQTEATLGRIAADLSFEPLREAPVPEGWPAPAPVGDVVVKDYPTYRMARAPMRSAGDMSAFWKLFQHIQSNDIPMTAPVQMDSASLPRRAQESGGKPEQADSQRSMAFLYESPERGPTGEQDKVEVVDVPAARWVSVGARGYDSPGRLEDLEATLRTWLAEHAPLYEVVGSARMMGWNSPSVRGDRRFFEVELPVRRRRDA
ncbi:MAG: heme-binding protein [Planctomycetota bacterium]